MGEKRGTRSPSSRRIFAGLGQLVIATLAATAANGGVNVWTSRGPGGGGDVSALMALPGSPTRLLAGTTSGSGAPIGGIWVSPDGGAGWHLAATLGEFGRVSALTQDPSDPSVVYAGTRWGILKSRDEGEHWVSLGAVEAGSLAIAPSRPTTVYAVLVQGLFRSEDGAVTWRPIGSHLPAGTQVTTVAVQPDSELTVYVGTAGNGVLKTTDGGETWAAVSTGMPSTALDRVIFLTFDFHTPARLLAVVDSSSYGAALYRSTDGGESWTGIVLPIATESIASVVLSRRSPDLIHLATGLTVLRSTDDGAQWSVLEVQAPMGTWIRTLAVDPNNAEVLYAGIAVGGDVLKSVDGGTTWTPSGRGIPASSVQALAVAPGPDATLHALVQTARNFAELFSSADHGVSWSSLGEIPGCTFPEAIAIDPSNPDILYVGGATGPLKSSDGGRSWASCKEGLSKVVHWVHSLAIDPTNPRVLYAGSERFRDWGMWWGDLVYRTTNGGAAWQVASSGLPTTTNARVRALAVDPRRPSTVYAGGSQLWRSIDAGRHWTAIASAGESLSVSAITIDPRDPDRVFCAAGGVMVKTTDGGASWSRQTPPGGAEVLALDPVNTDAVFVGAYGAVSMSVDGGTTWTPINGGLPFARVTALAIDGMGTVLHAATDGLGVFDLEFSTATPSISTTPDALTMLAGTSTAVVAAIDPPQLTDIQVLVSSSDSAIASVPAEVTLPAGDSSVPFSVAAGVATGRTAITVRLPGSMDGATATVDVTVAPPSRVPRRRLHETASSRERPRCAREAP